MNALRAFIRFSRPHTIIGTTLSVVGLYLMAYAHIRPEALFLPSLLVALLACLGANIYIVGLNQIVDLPIDRINKPSLPLASGAFTPRTGWLIVTVSLILAVGLAAAGGLYLTVTVLVSLLIGTAYSLPPIRLKRFHFWAAACIFTVRGVVVNIFLFLHFSRMFGGTDAIPLHIWILTAFIFGMSLVIAWFKDIPDEEGDRRFSITTLTIKLGGRQVFYTGLGLLTVCYMGLIGVGIWGLAGVNNGMLVISHVVLLALLWLVAMRIQPEEKGEITRFYLFIWVLFFSEYLFFATACLAA